MKHSSGPSPDWLTLRTHSHHHFVFVWSKTCRLIVSMHPLYCNSDLYVVTGCGGVLEYRFKRRCSSFFFSFFFLLNTLLFRHSQLLINIILFVKGNAAESSDYLGKFLKARIHIVLCTKSTFHSSSRLLSQFDKWCVRPANTWLSQKWKTIFTWKQKSQTTMLNIFQSLKSLKFKKTMFANLLWRISSKLFFF